MSFTIEIVSVPDRDGLVAEVWFGDAMVAELQRSVRGELRLEIYPSESQQPWSFDLHAWMAALQDAERRLG
jgi:hypothetical protein